MTSASDTAVPTARKAIAAWLLVVCAMIFAMVILGGVTRLTGSGLSMVRWNPIFGIVPPTSEARWQEVFDLYQQSPEYHKVNVGMDLQGFKGIFWLEYLHRVLGRLIGIVFFVPFLLFLLARKIPRSMAPKLLTMFVLGGLQGLLGWYMVKSGLVDNPHVSQYRLTAHLMFAVLIYAYILWVALGLLFPERSGAGVPRGLQLSTYGVLGLIALTMTSGAFVAGLKAGLAYNTFPLMAGKLIPPGMGLFEPWWRNLFENITTVQFDHRLLAMTALLAVVLLWAAARRSALPAGLRVAYHLLLAVAILQVSLGISTLLLRVPVPLASAHQATALALLTVALVLSHRVTAASGHRRAAETALAQPA